MGLIEKNDMLFAHMALHFAPGLSASARRVGAAIVDHFNKKTGQCDPSIDRLARLLGISRRSVLEATAELCSGENALFEKISHGGAAHRASYLPRWDRFNAIVDDWDLRMKDGAAPSKVQKAAPSRCRNPHVDGAEICTQTGRSNRSKEPSQTEAHRKGPANLPPLEAANHHPSEALNRRNGQGKQGAKPDRQRFMVHAISGGRGASRKDAAEGAAHRKLAKSIQSLGDADARAAAWLAAMSEEDDPKRPTSARKAAS